MLEGRQLPRAVAMGAATSTVTSTTVGRSERMAVTSASSSSLGAVTRMPSAPHARASIA